MKPVLSRIAHDVGKYVARTARNVPLSGAVPPVLVDMLAKDLYALSDGRRASALLAERLAELPEDDRDERLVAAGELLAEADRFEAALRDGDPAAVRRGAAIAIDVERLLREVAREALEPGGGGRDR